jgi:hypothetical protein
MRTFPILILPVGYDAIRAMIVRSPIFCVGTTCSSPTFRRNISPPSKSKPSRPQSRYLLISCLVHSSNLKIEAIRSSETSVNLYLSTQSYNPEVCTVHGNTGFLDFVLCLINQNTKGNICKVQHTDVRTLYN